MSFVEGAALPMASVTALQALRDYGRLKRGQRVLINGASGVGTFAVQRAKILGADVTAVCSAAKAELARSLGADHVIDYAKEIARLLESGFHRRNRGQRFRLRFRSSQDRDALPLHQHDRHASLVRDGRAEIIEAQQGGN